MKQLRLQCLPESISKSCYNCKHYSCHKEVESWELSHIFWYVYNCSVKPSIANLKSFPFKNTSCKLFEEKESLKISL